MPYTQPPVSPFQRYLRDPDGGISNANATPDSNSNSNPSVVLRDHVCKGLTPLNMERTRLVPRNQPGADWRAFLEVVLRDPGRAVFQVSCGIRCGTVWMVMIVQAKPNPTVDWQVSMEVVLRDPGRAVFQVRCGKRCG